jgi:hypothetical protein
VRGRPLADLLNATYRTFGPGNGRPR